MRVEPRIFVSFMEADPDSWLFSQTDGRWLSDTFSFLSRRLPEEKHNYCLLSAIIDRMAR